MSRKALTIASLSTIVCIAASAQAQETFKSAKFLTYPAESQKSYIGTAVMMAGVIASQNVPDQASCVDRWATSHESTGYKPVIDAMKRLPEYHPTAVILAVLDKECGSFKYKKP